MASLKVKALKIMSRGQGYVPVLQVAQDLEHCLEQWEMSSLALSTARVGTVTSASHHPHCEELLPNNLT